ncbi:MAG: YjgP/YjgQ family permease [Oscillatoriales cyanobacterium]|nr:MAG: YjgP/YjgQ family permease [Oscillatoriales cyanobacterium]
MKIAMSKSFNPLNWLPRISVMDWYIVKELMGPFLFGVGLFTSVAITVGALFELVRRVAESGLPYGAALEIFMLQIPYFVVLAFPMSMLLATLMAYSRMSSDSELVALRSCGVSVYRLVIPAVILGLVVTALTFPLQELVVPAANYRATLTLDKALKRETPLFQKGNIIYTEFRTTDKSANETLARFFYAEEFDGKRMKGLTIIDRSTPGLNQIVSSESATWNPSENTWDFFNGTAYIVAPDGSYRNIVRFEHQQLKLPRTPLDLAARARDFKEMNIAVRIQEKYAFPFVSMVFAIVGAALGTQPRRSGKGTSFGISVVVIFTYYVFSFITSSMGVKAVLSPILSAWLPIAFGFGIGGVLLVRAASR